MSLGLNSGIRNYLQVRCCSFCRRPGHTITTCNSQYISMFENNLLFNIGFNTRIYRNNSPIEILRNYLLNESLRDSHVVKAFAISRCGASIRSNIDVCIDKIIQYLTTNSQQGSTSLFSGLNSGMESQNEFMTFINIISSISESAPLNRKFYIKIDVLENQDNLEQKCECAICYEESENKNFIKLNCGHEFCKVCIKQTLQNEIRQNTYCALCRSDIKKFEIKLQSIKDEFNDLITTEL